MRAQNYYIDSAKASQQPGAKCAVYHWKNIQGVDIPPRGFVHLVHGLGEYLGRYEELALFLNQLGFDVYGLDFAGHGLSAQSQSKLDTIDAMVEELRALRKWWVSAGPVAKRGIAQAPWYIVSHSMGSMVALTWILEGKKSESDGEFAAKAFVSAPPLKLRLKVPAWKVQLGNFLMKLAPDLKLNNELNPESLSYDAANVARYRADKLVHPYSSPNNYFSMLAAAERAYAHSADIEIPICLAVGADDPIVSAAGVKALYEKLATHKSYLEFPHMKHEIFNEVNRKLVYDAVAHWLLS